jgi:hypothetical protein
MGTPRASPTSSTKPASTGRVARPSSWGRYNRWAWGPIRATRAFPRAMASPPSTTRLRTTSTRARAAPAATLNDRWDSVKISVVKVW